MVGAQEVDLKVLVETRDLKLVEEDHNITLNIFQSSEDYFQ